MNYQQKLHALQALAECSLKMRRIGDWYVSQPVEVKSGLVLISRYGNGPDPQAAIEDHWEQLTELAPGECIVIDAASQYRKQVKWNGFMWESAE